MLVKKWDFDLNLTIIDYQILAVAWPIFFLVLSSTFYALKVRNALLSPFYQNCINVFLT